MRRTRRDRTAARRSERSTTDRAEVPPSRDTMKRSPRSRRSWRKFRELRETRKRIADSARACCDANDRDARAGAGWSCRSSSREARPLEKRAARSCSCRKRSERRQERHSSRSAPAPAATRRRSSRPTSTACTRATPSDSAGRSRSLTLEPDRQRRLQGSHRSRSRATSVYSRLKFESGVHRVQRVPATEAQGRIHTSAATVAVLPEAEEVDVEINEKDLRIDVYRSAAPAARASTRPTPPCASRTSPPAWSSSCQDERSQLKNRRRR